MHFPVRNLTDTPAVNTNDPVENAPTTTTVSGEPKDPAPAAGSAKSTAPGSAASRGQTEPMALTPAATPSQAMNVTPAAAPSQAMDVTPAVTPSQAMDVTPAVAPGTTQYLSPPVAPERPQYYAPPVAPPQAITRVGQKPRKRTTSVTVKPEPRIEELADERVNIVIIPNGSQWPVTFMKPKLSTRVSKVLMSYMAQNAIAPSTIRFYYASFGQVMQYDRSTVGDVIKHSDPEYMDMGGKHYVIEAYYEQAGGKPSGKQELRIT
ncbi:hypothetical protein BZA05DRAFT_443866 [Tricharina praecox]|uniref:uncharacterized protein n=1 Tax=Tricharina praecox TaxID=43433 RepID=UPI002220957C|nr:uncharacterized protein BZA05DRAFT_443866 [Tricharina praecox]KAI5854365.1 hypothetical protein BZA05DRAFT_443866 [Tricharina praecox]